MRWEGSAAASRGWEIRKEGGSWGMGCGGGVPKRGSSAKEALAGGMSSQVVWEAKAERGWGMWQVGTFRFGGR